MKNWISSDLHFWHRNVIKYCNRPYGSVEEMNEGIIENFNSVIAPDDNLYLLGDISFSSGKLAAEMLSRMNGNKHLIIGNHDAKIIKDLRFLEELSSFSYYKEKKIGGANVVMMHYPIHSWNRKHYGSIHLFGHLHGNPIDLGSGRYKDVGVDTNNMMPYNLDTLVEEMLRWDYKHKESHSHEETRNSIRGFGGHLRGSVKEIEFMMGEKNV